MRRRRAGQCWERQGRGPVCPTLGFRAPWPQRVGTGRSHTGRAPTLSLAESLLCAWHIVFHGSDPVTPEKAAPRAQGSRAKRTLAAVLSCFPDLPCTGLSPTCHLSPRCQDFSGSSQTQGDCHGRSSSSHSWVPRNRSRSPCHQGYPGSPGPAGGRGVRGGRAWGDSFMGIKAEAGLQVWPGRGEDLTGLWDTGLSPGGVGPWRDM